MKFVDLGRKPYFEVLELQKELHIKRVRGEIDDTIIFCEHDPVFTIGKKEPLGHWLTNSDAISSDGIFVIKTDRGGFITYHGPGQLVGYPIFKLGKRGIADFVSSVTEACRLALLSHGINATLDKDHPGLWIDQKKIVALGFRISEGVSMHGFAINVDPNLLHYRHIVPCGIRNKGVTSMAEQGRKITLQAVRDSVFESFCRVFDDQAFSTDEKVSPDSFAGASLSSSKTFI